eukprot:COSAG03_NODE_20444_length_319_cov_0.704545_1_plen_32_part_10
MQVTSRPLLGLYFLSLSVMLLLLRLLVTLSSH